MARKKKPLPILENVTITDCAAEGKAVQHDLYILAELSAQKVEPFKTVGALKHIVAEELTAAFVLRARRRCRPAGQKEETQLL